MAARLKSIFRAPQSALLLKSLIFGGFLLLLKLGDFGFLPILFFLWAAWILSSGAHNSGFWVLLAVAMATVQLLASPIFLLAAVIIFSAIFYLNTGIKELILAHRRELGYLKNILLFYALFLYFFVADHSTYFWLKYLLVFLAVYLIFREWLGGSGPELTSRQKITAWVLAFLIAEELWITALLPLGPINSANLALLTAYILFDSVRRHFEGRLNRRAILQNLTIYILLLLVIFATTQWGIR